MLMHLIVRGDRDGPRGVTTSDWCPPFEFGIVRGTLPGVIPPLLFWYCLSDSTWCYPTTSRRCYPTRDLRLL
jgi:hypothetical protein